MANAPDSRGASEKPAQPLDEALTKSKQVSEEIKDAAEELGVVHAVLDTQLSKDPKHEDVQEAVARTQELEKRLVDSADKLDSAVEHLEKQVSSSVG